jgi:hypothetical protein
MNVEFLFVTCCLEPSRVEILKEVIANLKINASDVCDSITVFDNASNQPDVESRLIENFKNVYVASRNVGYWTAIDWWLNKMRSDPPQYTYIIESDMIHYDFNRIWDAKRFLDENTDIGAVRCHEYSIENAHLYNKDIPLKNSRCKIWQSHTNKISGKPVQIDKTRGYELIYPASFLTQLPALNRYKTMLSVFDRLRELPNFSELDFQRMCYEAYPLNAIIDGGIFHCDPGAWGSRTVTGSWSPPEELAKTGYQNTRYASIVQPNQYTVTRVG